MNLARCQAKSRDKFVKLKYRNLWNKTEAQQFYYFNFLMFYFVAS